MAGKEEKEYICAYKYCLHHGDRVKDSESVVINRKHYHWDCAGMKQEITDCVNTYMSYIEDKTKYPIDYRAINTMVFKNRVPIEYIRKNIESSKLYYSQKPVQVLYGIRKLFYEQEFKV